MVVILGTPHGANVAGKRSPDGSLLEYAYGRKVINKLKPMLEAKGYIVYVDIPQDIVPLPQSKELETRANFVNGLCTKYGTANCIYVSIHVNAASNGGWKDAGGWCCFTTKGTTKSDALAECLYNSAEKHLKPYETIMAEGKKKGYYSKAQRPYRIDKADGDKDLESNFYVIRKTKCTAVLTENLFQDNKEDVKFLLSEDGFNAIVNLHYDGIVDYCENH